MSTSRSRDSFYHLPLFLCALSSASVSSSSLPLTHSLARSVRHTRHGISPIPSFPPRFFLLRISSPRSTLFSPLSFSPSSISLSRGCSLIYSHPTLFRAPLPLPLFSLLVCFPLPVGNCTLSLLPSRRFPLVRICHCSSIRFRVFCLPTVTLPPSFSSYDLFLAPFHSVSCPRSLSPPSFLCSSIFHHRLSAACPRDKKKAIQVAGIGAFAPGRASNLIIRRLIIREKGTRITRVQLFSPESFRSPFIGDLMRRSIACRARICADLTRARG